MKHDDFVTLIATVVNCKTLEVYRQTDVLDMHKAKRIDAHLLDLGDRIVEALEDAGGMLEPDEFERCMAIRQRLERRSSDAGISHEEALEIIEWVFGPDEPEDDPPDAPKSAAIELVKPAADESTDARTTSGPAETSPIDGDEAEAGAATDVSAQPPEEPTTVQETAAAEKQTQSPSSGGDSAANPEEYDIAQLAADIDAWRKEHGHTIAIMEKLIGVSNWTISAMLRHRKVSMQTVKKTRNAIRKDAKKQTVKAAEAPAKPAPAKSEPAKPATLKVVPKDPLPGDPPAAAEAPKPTDTQTDLTPGAFIARWLKQWLTSQGLDAATASSVLSVRTAVLQDILAGNLPVDNVIHQLAKNVPAIRNSYKFLMRAANKSAG